METGPTIRTGYFSQENEYMDESLKAIEYIREVAEYITTEDGKITASALMERFPFLTVPSSGLGLKSFQAEKNAACICSIS